MLITACVLWLALGAGGERSSWRMLRAQMAASALDSPTSVQALQASEWRPLDQSELAHWRGPYWLRFELALAPNAPANGWLLALALRGASRVYWDGALLGENGKPSAHPDDEVPGRIDVHFPLDRTRAGPGQHEVLVYASSHFASTMAHAGVDLRLLSLAQFGKLGWRWLLVAVACGAIATALLTLALAFAAPAPAVQIERGRGWLLALGALGLVLPLAEAWRPLLGYSYDWHSTRLWLIFILHAAAALLLPLYLAARFASSARDLPRGLILAWLALLLVQALLNGFDLRSWTVQLGGLLLASSVLWPCWRTQPESRPLSALLASMVALSLLFPADFLDGLYFIGLAVLMVYLLLRHADFLQSLRGEHARLSAQRDRLSAQLLQRAMQPHWLMNTLTSLQELIEQSPEQASRLVDLLAQHFALLRNHSQREWVSLSDEISLCQVQLDIAAQAQQRPIVLRVSGTCSGVDLPPGILHTLIENSLTHAGFSACSQTGFDLDIGRREGRVHLRLRAPLARYRGARRDVAAGSGTGTLFINASLERAFGGRARFNEQAVDDCWQSEIEITCAS